jgi:hypothetical protein
MAAVAVSIGVDVLNDIVAAIPGGLALWNAIVGLRAQNPGLTQAQAAALMAGITATIATVGADELAQLALIPPAPAAPALKPAV